MDAARHTAGHGFGTEEGPVALSRTTTKLSYSSLLTEAAVARLVELVRPAHAGSSLQALQRGEAVEQLTADLRARFRGAHLAREVLSSALQALQAPADASAVDVFRATFPAGTMTGAPKVRAMEIIDELEPERRGPYAGAVGYIASGDRRMDLAITIRTCVVANGTASVQAGAGIVADSVPEREWEETENKARAMLTAIGRVRGLGGREQRGIL